ncbi:MAG: SMC-Scp complex subunit ScpB, partial [Candidatus Nanohaloarchaeota archaeon]|nr:SMC-Scp complex subunit ScpB [Candidatus Nanohaloarchaeota archaeon]
AALFTNPDPLHLNDLYRVLNHNYALQHNKRKISKEAIKQKIADLNAKLEKHNLPWRIDVKLNNYYDLVLENSIFKYVESLAPFKDLSRATLQTLALIAYKSPVEQKEVVKIRGQRAYEQIKELLEQGFITSERKGHTNILKISKKLLKYFGVKNEEELKKFMEERMDRNFSQD